MPENLTEKLKQFKQDFSKTKETRNDGFVDPPDGIYSCSLANCEVCESKAGRMQVKWEFLVNKGEYMGKILYRYDGITDNDGQYNEIGMGFLTRDLDKFGVETDSLDIEDLPEACKFVLNTGASLKIKIVRKAGKAGGEFVSKYIDAVEMG